MFKHQLRQEPSTLCARALLGMSSKLSCNRVVVGSPGTWTKTTLDNKKRVERFVQRELHAPVPWLTYAYEEKRLTTNAKLVKRTWERPLGSTGPGVEVSELVISPHLGGTQGESPSLRTSQLDFP